MVLYCSIRSRNVSVQIHQVNGGESIGVYKWIVGSPRTSIAGDLFVRQTDRPTYRQTLTLRTERQSARMSKITNDIRHNPVWQSQDPL